MNVYVVVMLFAACLGVHGQTLHALSWADVRDKFETTNLTLQAARLSVEESREQEVTAYLRPNPQLTLLLDQLDPFTPDPYRPLQGAMPVVSLNYPHERDHKRELRRDSARQATQITASQLADQERNLLLALRTAFVQTLQQKAVLALAQDNLAYWNQILQVSRDRFQAGDLSQADLNKLEVQKVQYDSDLVVAATNLRTAKIQLLALMNDRTTVEQFDVTGPFDFPNRVPPLEDFRMMAIENRPDLKAAREAVEKAGIDYRLARANGSTDPTFEIDAGRQPPLQSFIGFSVNIPLRIFDRNQGEKARAQIDITRTERLRNATETQVYSDVDSAYASLLSNLTLLGAYKTTYLGLAAQVRDTEMFAYQNGGASLLEFLQAQQDYRTVQTNHLNLIGSYLMAAGQLSLAVGKEVIP